MEFPSQMLRLKSQEQFETEVLRSAKLNSEDTPKAYVLGAKTGSHYICILFSAAWCGPCKKLDKEALISAHADITWYGCDVDENTYTHGYCGLKKIPSFVFIRDGKVVDTLQGTIDVGTINSWLYVARTKA